MTYLIERLAELRRHLDHLKEIRPKVTGRSALEQDLSLKNDVLFSLLTVCQLVIDIAGELSASRGERFGDYTEAIRNLASDNRYPDFSGKAASLFHSRSVLKVICARPTAMSIRSATTALAVGICPAPCP